MSPCRMDATIRGLGSAGCRQLFPGLSALLVRSCARSAVGHIEASQSCSISHRGKYMTGVFRWQGDAIVDAAAIKHEVERLGPVSIFDVA